MRAVFKECLIVHRGWFHPEHFPDVTVQVIEAASVHEAVVLRRSALRCTGGDRLIVDRVHSILALEGKGQEHFGVLGRITGRLPFRQETLQAFGRVQHCTDGVTDHQRSRIVVGELGIERIAERFEEGFRLGKVVDLHVDEDLGVSPRSSIPMNKARRLARVSSFFAECKRCRNA